MIRGICLRKKKQKQCNQLPLPFNQRRNKFWIPFSEQEDAKLIQEVKEKGKNFKLIARSFSKRSSDTLKNRYYSVIRHLPEFQLEMESKCSSFTEEVNNSFVNNKQQYLISEFNSLQLDEEIKYIFSHFLNSLNQVVSNLNFTCESLQSIEDKYLIL